MHADERENQSAEAGRGLLGLVCGPLDFGDRGVDLADPAGESPAGSDSTSSGRTTSAWPGSSGSNTNWTNSVSRTHEFELDDLADASTRDG